MSDLEHRYHSSSPNAACDACFREAGRYLMPWKRLEMEEQARVRAFMRVGMLCLEGDRASRVVVRVAS